MLFNQNYIASNTIRAPYTTNKSILTDNNNQMIDLESGLRLIINSKTHCQNDDLIDLESGLKLTINLKQ